MACRAVTHEHMTHNSNIKQCLGSAIEGRARVPRQAASLSDLRVTRVEPKVHAALLIAGASAGAPERAQQRAVCRLN
eukprot:14849657-Alexandrium_andersonii.AAC.1